MVQTSKTTSSENLYNKNNFKERLENLSPKSSFPFRNTKKELLYKPLGKGVRCMCQKLSGIVTVGIS